MNNPRVLNIRAVPADTPGRVARYLEATAGAMPPSYDRAKLIAAARILMRMDLDDYYARGRAKGE